MRHISGPDSETARYVINPEPMDAARVAWPAHIGKRDSQLGYGDRCWLVFCGGVAINAGIDAIRDVYPAALVTTSKQLAAAWLRDWPIG